MKRLLLVMPLSSLPSPLSVWSTGLSRRLLAFLLAVDVVLIALAFALTLEWTRNPAFSLTLDGGYSEIFQYVKEGGIGLCFAVMAWTTRQPVYAVLSFLFFFLLLDDALELHETMGLWLADGLGLGPAFGLRARDFGEVLFAAGVGVTALALGLAAYRFSDGRARQIARYTAAAVVVLAAFGAFGAFGVGVDLVHQVFEEVHLVGYFFMMLEDGGELLVMSVIAAAQQVISPRHPEPLA